MEKPQAATEKSGRLFCMENLTNRINQAQRILRVDIQEFLNLTDVEDKKQALTDFLTQFEFVSKEDQQKILADIDSYDY